MWKCGEQRGATGGWAVCTVLIPCSRFDHEAQQYVSIEIGILLYTTGCECLELNATGHCGCDSINRLKKYQQTDGQRVCKQILKDQAGMYPLRSLFQQVWVPGKQENGLQKLTKFTCSPETLIPIACIGYKMVGCVDPSYPLGCSYTHWGKSPIREHPLKYSCLSRTSFITV